MADIQLASTDKPGSSRTAARPPSIKRAASSRFSMLLENNVDYSAYRQAYGRQFLQQQPQFDSIPDAEIELKSVLHDNAFTHTGTDGSIAAENVALAVDWFVSALALLFDDDEPFQNADFLRMCCMFFASPLYENNARLVQRHFVKRAYAELDIAAELTKYGSTLWLLLAFLHLITEFQSDTYLLCRDSGLFPLLQRLVLGSQEKRLHVLAMSLMFELALTVPLSNTDFSYVTEELLLFLLDYVECMRYAETDIYNNTGTKLVLALNEQYIRLQGGYRLDNSRPTSSASLAINSGAASPAMHVKEYSSHARTSSASLPAVDIYSNKYKCKKKRAPPPPPPPPSSSESPLYSAAPSKSPLARVMADTEDYSCPQKKTTSKSMDREGKGATLLRSRSMDFRAFLENELHGGSNNSHSYKAKKAALTPVTAILGRRIDCCKTFTENLVFLLNRETDPDIQVLILHMLGFILTDSGTLGILYTNDMHVLVDIIIRDLSNMSDGMEQLRQAYLGVVNALLRCPLFLSTRHRLPDMELCLVNILRHSLVSSSYAGTSDDLDPNRTTQQLLPLSRRRRGSGSSSTSTRHNSITSDITITMAANPPRIESPTGSSTSEDTCVVAPRRPVPPPRTSTPQASQPKQLDGRTRRRRAPPPPPLPQQQQHDSQTARSTPHRRRPPPPPPPPQPSAVAAAAQPNTANKKTGLRRQLSVKNSVSLYKSNTQDKQQQKQHRPPTPPPRKSNRGQENQSPPPLPTSEPAAAGTAELLDRRNTRRLVESALRSCREARAMVVT